MTGVVRLIHIHLQLIVVYSAQDKLTVFACSKHI